MPRRGERASLSKKLVKKQKLNDRSRSMSLSPTTKMSREQTNKQTKEKKEVKAKKALEFQNKVDEPLSNQTKKIAKRDSKSKNNNATVELSKGNGNCNVLTVEKEIGDGIDVEVDTDEELDYEDIEQMEFTATEDEESDSSIDQEEKNPRSVRITHAGSWGYVIGVPYYVIFRSYLHGVLIVCQKRGICRWGKIHQFYLQF